MSKPVKRKYSGKYNASVKIAIAREYLSSDLGVRALGAKYNIPPSTIRDFVKWYQQKYSEGVKQHPETGQPARAVDEASLKITALQMLIENASKELGIDLVKKFGTKQQSK